MRLPHSLIGVHALYVVQDMNESTPQISLNTEDMPDNSGHRNQGRIIAALALVLYAGPIWGMIGTIIGMMRSFNSLAQNEVARQEDLTAGISFALNSTMIGFCVGLLGFILILVSMIITKNREKWFFWWSVILSIPWFLTMAPFGSIIGLPIFTIFILKRAEFDEISEAQQAAPRNR